MNNSITCDMMLKEGRHCEFEDTDFMQNTCGNFSVPMLMLHTTMLAMCEISDPCRRPGTNDIDDNKV